MYVRALSPTTTTLRRKKEEPQDPYASAQKGPNYHALVRVCVRVYVCARPSVGRPCVCVWMWRGVSLRWLFGPSPSVCVNALFDRSVGRLTLSHIHSLIKSNQTQIPLMYAPALPLIRIGLRGRLPQKQIDYIFGGAVLTALAHAGYIMGSDSSV